MDTTHALFEWLDGNEDLKEFNVPLMSDKNHSIAEQFGVLQHSQGQCHTGVGYPANSVFIIDSKDNVRYHCVLDSRVGFNIREIGRLVRAFMATDGGSSLAMTDLKEEKDAVKNAIPSIRNYYAAKYDGEMVEEAEDTSKESIHSSGKGDVVLDSTSDGNM